MDLFLDSYTLFLQIIGQLHCSLGHHNDSKIALDEALVALSSYYGQSSHPEAWSLVYALTENFRYPGCYQQAAEACDLLLHLCVEYFKERGLLTALSLFSRAQIVRDIGLYEEALELYQKSLRYLDEEIGRDNCHYSKVLGEYGECQRLLHDYPSALDSLNQAIELRRKHYGQHHLLSCQSMCNLATIYIDMDEKPKAEKLLTHEVIPLLETHIGSNHPLTFYAKGNLGICHSSNVRNIKLLVDIPISMASDRSINSRNSISSYDSGDNNSLVYDMYLKLRHYDQYPFPDNHPWILRLRPFVMEGSEASGDNESLTGSVLRPESYMAPTIQGDERESLERKPQENIIGIAIRDMEPKLVNRYSSSYASAGSYENDDNDSYNQRSSYTGHDIEGVPSIDSMDESVARRFSAASNNQGLQLDQSSSQASEAPNESYMSLNEPSASYSRESGHDPDDQNIDEEWKVDGPSIKSSTNDSYLNEDSHHSLNRESKVSMEQSLGEDPNQAAIDSTHPIISEVPCQREGSVEENSQGSNIHEGSYADVHSMGSNQETANGSYIEAFGEEHWSHDESRDNISNSYTESISRKGSHDRRYSRRNSLNRKGSYDSSVSYQSYAEGSYSGESGSQRSSYESHPSSTSQSNRIDEGSNEASITSLRENSLISIGQTGYALQNTSHYSSDDSAS